MRPPGDESAPGGALPQRKIMRYVETTNNPKQNCESANSECFEEVFYSRADFVLEKAYPYIIIFFVLYLTAHLIAARI